MGAEVIILANPYTYNFLKGLTHSAMMGDTRRRKSKGSMALNPDCPGETEIRS